MLLRAGARFNGSKLNRKELIGSLSSVETGHFKLMWIVDNSSASLGLLYPFYKGIIYSKVVDYCYIIH